MKEPVGACYLTLRQWRMIRMLLKRRRAEITGPRASSTDLAEREAEVLFDPMLDRINETIRRLERFEKPQTGAVMEQNAVGEGK